MLRQYNRYVASTPTFLEKTLLQLGIQGRGGEQFAREEELPVEINIRQRRITDFSGGILH